MMANEFLTAREGIYKNGRRLECVIGLKLEILLPVDSICMYS